MDLKKYVSDATRTESRIDEVVANQVLVESLFTILISAGQMLDQVKKNTFYGKPFNKEKFDAEFEKLDRAAEKLAPITGLKHVLDADKQTLAYNPRLFHSVVGVATETAELLEALNNPSLDKVNLLEEFGDINWYEAIAVDELNGDFQALLERNIAKLRARFPHKFTSENAINRDLETERAILEGKDNGTA